MTQKIDPAVLEARRAAVLETYSKLGSAADATSALAGDLVEVAHDLARCFSGLCTTVVSAMDLGLVPDSGEGLYAEFEYLAARLEALAQAGAIARDDVPKLDDIGSDLWDTAGENAATRGDGIDWGTTLDELAEMTEQSQTNQANRTIQPSQLDPLDHLTELSQLAELAELAGSQWGRPSAGSTPLDAAAADCDDCADCHDCDPETVQ